MKILFLSPYPHAEAPSQRFRFEQYFKYLKEEGIEYKQVAFLSESTFRVLYEEGFVLAKSFGVIAGFLRRFWMLFSVLKYDYVFIHREATPLGWPWVEWMIAKVWRKKVIYDFDDAIWLSNTSASNKMIAIVKNHGKVKSICRWAYKVSVGNEYLRAFALKYNPNVQVLPTTLLQEVVLKKTKEHTSHQPIVVGWIGTHSTLKYLTILEKVLQEMEHKYSVVVRVVSNKPPEIQVKNLDFVKWSKEEETDVILSFDIGVMPLPDSEWEKGKCSFKALQYMSLGIPAVVSPVGMNKEIIQSGENGFLCNDDQQWLTAFEKLIENVALRKQLALAGKAQILDRFTDEANRKVFLSLFS